MISTDPRDATHRLWDHWNGRPADVELEAPAIAAMAAAARQALCGVADAAGLATGELRDITVAVGEAYSNAATHAYGEDDHGPVWLRIWVDPTAVRIVVSDIGRGLTANDSGGGDGLGVPLMRALASQFDVSCSTSGQTVVDMTFDRGVTQ